MAFSDSIIAILFTLFINYIYEVIKDAETNPEKTWFIFDNASLPHSKEFVKF